MDELKLPLLDEGLPGGLRFGANYLVEFEPQSLWYEASVTLCAQALRMGIRADFHTFTRPTDEIRGALERLDIDVKRLEKDDTFRIWDSYTVQTGLGKAAMIGKASPRERIDLRSVKIEDWDKGVSDEVGEEVPEVEKRRLHIDDNTSVLLQFNDAKSVVEHFRTLTIPYARKLEIAAIHSLVTGVYPENIYRQFESFCDGVIDFGTREQDEALRNLMRVRSARGGGHDSRWRNLELLGNGEVVPGRGSSPPIGESPASVSGARGQRVGVESGSETDQSEGERRLAAIMFTDMVGFTSLAQKDEALAMELLGEQRRLVRPMLARHKGREVKTIGDGFLVEFASALDAVRCAVEVQTFLKNTNDARPDAKRIWVRIGIHLGDVIHSGTDVAGDAVNVASRIEALAPPGGVCLSGQVHSSVANKVAYEFESLGRTELKNVSDPMEVFRVAGLGRSTGTATPAKQGPPAERIAILPFANISRDPADEYFAEGMTEELISAISKVRGLRVIARTSVMSYRGTDKRASEIGRELGVGSLLEGSVRKEGKKVRINVQLVNTISEEPLWSDEYDRDLQDIFAIQSDIGKKVASALQVRVLQPEQMAGGKDPRIIPEAYEKYLRGRQLWSRRSNADLTKSVKCFEEALTIDPGYAKAYSGLADAYSTLALLEFMPPAEAFPKAKVAVQKALSLDEGLAEAHTSLGLVRFQYDWDWSGAEREFNRAIELNQNYAPAHQFFADYLKAMGRFDEAVREMGYARELDPLSLSISAGLGHVLYLSRQYDKAIEQYKKTIELDPDFMQTHLWFGRPYLEKGMYDEAISELQTAVRLSGESTLSLGMLGHGLASAGKVEEAMGILDKLLERMGETYVPSYWVAAVFNGMKDRDQTIMWLGKAYEERSSWLVWVGVEPRFDWIKGDAEFVSLLRSMNFPATAFNH